MSYYETDILKQKISDKRFQLEYSVSKNEMISEEVLSISRELDELIISYYKLIYKEEQI